MRHLRTIVRVVAMAGLAFLLSGCLKVHQDLTLHEDNTVDGVILFAVSEQLLGSIGQDADQALEEIFQGGSPVPEGVDFEVQDYDDGEFVGQEFTFEGVPIEEMTTGDDSVTITREGDTFVVDGAADLSQAAEQIDPNDPTTQQMLESFEVRVSVTFPGAVTESNGEVDGTTATWTPQIGEVNEIHAVGQATGGGGGALMWILLAVAALVLAGIIVAMVRAGKRGAVPDAEAGSTEAADVPLAPTPPLAPEAPASIPPPETPATPPQAPDVADVADARPPAEAPPPASDVPPSDAPSST